MADCKVTLFVEVGKVGYKRDVHLPIPPFIGLHLELMVSRQLWGFNVKGVSLYEEKGWFNEWSSFLVTLEVDQIDLGVKRLAGHNLEVLMKNDEAWHHAP